MNSTVLLHIGTRKTGTSSIQEALAQAQEAGQLGPVCYPMPDGGRHHSSLANLYLPHARLPRADHLAFPEDDEQFAAAQRRYRELFFGSLNPANAVIASSETLILLSPQEVRGLRDDFETAGFRDFRIVLYVRDPADYYLSEVQQDLRASSQLANPNSFRYGFRRIAETWERVFPGQLLVRHYQNRPQYDVVQDFSEVLRGSFGVSLASIPARLNTTISAEGMEILQRYRSTFWIGKDGVFTPDTRRLVKFLQRSLSELPQTTPLLTPWIAEVVRFNHRDDADFLADLYGVDLGLRETGQPSRLSVAELRVADVVQQVDPTVVDELLRRVAKAGLDRNPHVRHLPARIASRLSRLTGRSTLSRR